MQSFALVIFGITGNLAQIKLIPALYDLEESGYLPENISIIGMARRQMSPDQFRSYVREILNQENRHHKHAINEEIFQRLCKKLYYVDGQLDDPVFYNKLDNFFKDLSEKGVDCNNKIFYLATYPKLYENIFQNLKDSGLSNEGKGFVRLVVEKPIGTDLPSAQKLNILLKEYFKETQIFRLDHYLGKETIQNILTFRFGNDIFEPFINKDYIDHIQISALEDFGIGKRGGYYDSVGALKDFGQNHLLQMLSFVTMDSPTNLNSQEITKKRLEILKNLKPDPTKIVYGQYEEYRNEENIDPNSNTDTYFAFKTEIDNERFKNVPIYIRSGKKLSKTVTEISIVFKNPTTRLFKELECGEEPNVLVYRIQPNEGIVLKILTKKPGYKLMLEPSYMQFCYKIDLHNHYLPDAYERLLIDVLEGSQTFFNTADEVEAQWAFTDPLTQTDHKPFIYQPGSWGPKEADELIEKDGKSWLEPSVDFCRF